MRCPYYIKMDGFDKLAKTVNVKLSKEGIEALAEICEMFGEMLLKNAKNSKYLNYKTPNEFLGSSVAFRG